MKQFLLLLPHKRSPGQIADCQRRLKERGEKSVLEGKERRAKLMKKVSPLFLFLRYFISFDFF